MTHFKAAQRTYRVWDNKAQIEFQRLFDIDKIKKLTFNANPNEHAIFSHLCHLREGNIHDF